jgi:TPR repeat protein
MRALMTLVVAATVACRSHAPNERIAKLAVDAATGDSTARYNLAVELYRGDSVSRDYTKAAALWKQSMEQGSINATNNYAYLLYYGLGIPKDERRAVTLWKRAAALGQPESDFHLGAAALDGSGEPVDTAEAVARYRAALVLAVESSDSTDRLVARDVRVAIAQLPPLAYADKLRADSLFRTYTQQLGGLRHQ